MAQVARAPAMIPLLEFLLLCHCVSYVGATFAV